MTTLLVLFLSLGLLSSTQSTSYNCLTINGVGCICGQGYINDNGVCKQLMPTIACADGFIWNGTACTSQRTITCPNGQIFNGSVCIALTSVITSNLPCNSNQLYINGRCIPPSGNGACPFNFIWNGSQCITDSNPRPIIVTVPTVKSNLNFVQTPFQPLQIVCQTGYYYNCRTCVPVNGKPICASTCEWNGEACVDQTTGNTPNQQSPSFNRFYEGVQSYESEDQSNRRGSINRGFNSNNRYQIKQSIVCPNAHCYNGNTCIPFSGKLITVNCPTEYTQRNYAPQRRDSIQSILSQLPTKSQIIYATPQNNLQSYGNQNQNQSSQLRSGFTLSSSSAIPTPCQIGQYWNGKYCTRD